MLLLEAAAARGMAAPAAVARRCSGGGTSGCSGGGTRGCSGAAAVRISEVYVVPYGTRRRDCRWQSWVGLHATCSYHSSGRPSAATGQRSAAGRPTAEGGFTHRRYCGI